MRLKCDNCEKSSFVSRNLGLFSVLVLPLALVACDEPKVAQQQVRPVKAMIIPAAVTERTLTYSGVIAPRIDSSLGFRVSGKIVERYVNAGDQVTEGQNIARLDEKDLKLAENSARSAVAGAKTRVSVAKDALQRANFLLPNGFIAKSAVDQRQLEFDSAQSALDAAQDQLKQAVNATGYALLLADKDGIVTSVRAEPGQVVSVGQAVITLAHANDIEVLVAVPEQEIARLKAGDPALVALWSASNLNSEGKIREIAGTADIASRTYAVRVTITRPVPEMRLGMTTSISFKVPQDTPAVIAPLTALTEQNGKTIAFVATRDRQVVRREVEVEGVTSEGAMVKSGLLPGEILVTGGVQFLQDGMRVRLPKEVLPSLAETASAH
jgi:membrane fusion protein, multidrug efflux system